MKNGIGVLFLWGMSQLALGQGPYNTNQNSYWPMKVGNKWIMRNPTTGSATVITVQPSPAHFGCAPNTSQAALSPFEIDIVKVDPNNYWSGNTPWNLRWYLGVQPAGQQPAGYTGDLYGFGWLTEDYSFGLPGQVSLNNSSDVMSKTSGEPAYELIRAGGVAGNFSANQDYPLPPSPPADIDGCAADPPNSINRYWTVTWQANIPVSTPRYNGQALEATYLENGGNYHGPDNEESWYFAPNVGVVKIQVTEPGSSTLELVSFTPGNGTPVSSFVTLRDLLVAKAGAVNGLTFPQWSTYFTQSTNLNAPSASQACVNPFNVNLPVSVDTYLSWLENVGTPPPYCTTVQYPATPNGLSANSMLQQMESRAGTSNGLDFDHWNYYYSLVEGRGGPTPDSACMKTATSTDPYRGSGTFTLVPNRWALTTGRQWLLFYEHPIFGCAS